MADKDVIWFLDVGGVLNASDPGWPEDEDRVGTGAAIADGRSWGIRWSPTLVRRIRLLYLAGAVDVRWCTTWCPFADNLESLLRLPPLPRAWDGEYVRFVRQLKLNVVRDALQTGHHVIWTDDEAVPRLGTEAGEKLRELGRGGRLLIIEPEPDRGLRPEHLDEIVRWLEKRHR